MLVVLEIIFIMNVLYVLIVKNVLKVNLENKKYLLIFIYYKDNQYLIFDGEPFCQECSKNKLKMCFGCSKEILDKAYSALNKYWHIKCFKCEKCKNPFGNEGYVIFDNQPFHQKCSIIFCKVCKGPINNDYFKLEGFNVENIIKIYFYLMI